MVWDLGLYTSESDWRTCGIIDTLMDALMFVDVIRDGQCIPGDGGNSKGGVTGRGEHLGVFLQERRRL